MAEKTESEIVVNAQILAKVLGVGVRQVSNLSKQGICVKNTSGRYLLVPSVQNYINRLRVEVQAEKRNLRKDAESDGRVADLNTERAVHEHVKRQMAELRLQLMRGQVFEEETVRFVVGNMLTNFKRKLQTLPTKMSSRAAGKSEGELEYILMQEVNDILKELAEYDPKDYISDTYIEEMPDGQD